MSIFELEKDQLVALPGTSFSAERIRERQDLQRILRSQIEVLGPDLLVIAEEYGDWEESQRRIDLLAVDREAKLVVIELKRTSDGGHMELQALRYAAMVSTMTFAQAVDAHRRFLTRYGKKTDPEEALLDFLRWGDVDEERFASDVRLLLVAQDFSRELTTAVMWLSERDLDIRCIRIRPYRLDERLLLDVQQIIPLPEAADYQIRIREKVIARRHPDRGKWTGYYYVNVGEGAHRNWEDCRRYGFVAAGGGRKWSDPLQKLQPGNKIYAYQKRNGYVGLGEVVSTAVPAKNFIVRETGTPILDADLTQPNLSRNRDDPDTCEWLVGIRWIRTVPLATAYTRRGIFANQHIVCRLRDPATLDFLAENLGSAPD